MIVMDNAKFLVFLCVMKTALSADWSYKGANGPSNWHNLEGASACAGQRQSPINIDTTEVQQKDTLGEFTFSGFNSQPTSMKLKNNGHTAQVDLEGDIKISGGGLSGVYKTAQFHFHWGSTDSKGSEHTINQKQYPMEIHFVHYSSKYSTLSSAVNKPDGLAVLGFFFEISDEDNPALTTLINGLGDILYDDEVTSLAPFTLSSILPSQRNEYFRYEGSLTTPTCAETVIWTVFNEKIKISANQLAAFRRLNSNEEGDTANAGKIEDNFRPVQAINSRTVYSSMDVGSSANSFTSASVVFLLMMPILAIHINRF